MSLARALPFAALGAGGAFAAATLWRRRKTAPSVEGGLGPPPSGAWVFPIPIIGDRWPVVSDGWGSKRGDQLHRGADLMYRRRHRAELVDVYPPGTSSGSLWHYMPDNTPALAASAGVIVFADQTPRGFSVVIRHADGWATYYTHLSSLLVNRSIGWRLGGAGSVVAGQPLGIIGHDPTDANRLRHLHFELWRGGSRAGATDPGPFLLAWPRIRRTTAADGVARADTLPASVAPRGRSSTLAYRPVGAPGEPYPAWVRDLRGKSGVYIIREIDGPIRYVGESHTDSLYRTLTRHFQAWRRYKSWWKDQYGEGHDPGLTYPRASVEVAVRVTSRARAIDEEHRLIQRLCPRDNLIGQGACDDQPIPF